MPHLNFTTYDGARMNTSSCNLLAASPLFGSDQCSAFIPPPTFSLELLNFPLLFQPFLFCPIKNPRCLNSSSISRTSTSTYTFLWIFLFSNISAYISLLPFPQPSNLVQLKLASRQPVGMLLLQCPKYLYSYVYRLMTVRYGNSCHYFSIIRLHKRFLPSSFHSLSPPAYLQQSSPQLHSLHRCLLRFLPLSPLKDMIYLG